MEITLMPSSYWPFDGRSKGMVFMKERGSNTIEIKLFDAVMGNTLTSWVYVDKADLKRAVEVLCDE